MGGSGACGVSLRPQTASRPLFPASPQGLAALGSRAPPPKKRALLSGARPSVCPAMELGPERAGDCGWKLREASRLGDPAPPCRWPRPGHSGHAPSLHQATPTAPPRPRLLTGPAQLWSTWYLAPKTQNGLDAGHLTAWAWSWACPGPGAEVRGKGASSPSLGSGRRRAWGRKGNNGAVDVAGTGRPLG